MTKSFPGRLRLTFFLCLLFASPLKAQQEPVLLVLTKQLTEAYLQSGPSKADLPDGSATANWAIMEKVGLPELLHQEPLQTGSWNSVWIPISQELDKQGFSSLEPLEALTWWEETRKDPQRFIRLLAQRGMVDARIPADRHRASALRDSLTVAKGKLKESRANVRFEKMGWSFTGTASLVPSQRIVRLALLGSQPCPNTGKARTSNLSLKARLFVDKSSAEGVKLQLLEHDFSSSGCEETLKTHVSAMLPLATGGEARVSGNLVLMLRDETITGRLLLDTSYRPAGESLMTGHGTYSLRGSLGADGTAHATLTPVSVSGSKMFRDSLNKAGVLEAQITLGQGSGSISLPAFRQALTWRATRG